MLYFGEILRQYLLHICIARTLLARVEMIGQVMHVAISDMRNLATSYQPGDAVSIYEDAAVLASTIFGIQSITWPNVWPSGSTVVHPSNVRPIRPWPALLSTAHQLAMDDTHLASACIAMDQCLVGSSTVQAQLLPDASPDSYCPRIKHDTRFGHVPSDRSHI